MIYPLINPTIITLFLILPVLILILLGLNLLLAPFNPDPEKTTSFECGFSPIYGQTRNPFHIQFYLVAIFVVFFLILTIGFVYELGHKVLDFSNKVSSSNSTKASNT